METDRLPGNNSVDSLFGKIIFSLFVIIIILSTGCMAGKVDPKELNLTMKVPFPPVPVQSDGIMNIAYELETDSFEEKGYHLVKAEAVDAYSGITLLSLEGDNLSAQYHPASVPPPTPEERMNGTKNLTNPRISFWIRMNPETMPERIIHLLTINSTSDSSLFKLVTGGEVVVRKNSTPVSIRSPLRGSYWTPLETTGPNTHHFLSQITVNNLTTVPQRYAQDWMMMDANGSLFSGDNLKNKNWIGYGKDLVAVADGTISRTLDGIADNVPVGTIPPLQVSNLSGNYVILDIGDGLYACYAHMIPGSIRVKTGDIVKKGDILGLLGNSGNSGAPHLHFQIVNGPGFFSYEGLPFTIDSFLTIESCNDGQDCDPDTHTRLIHHINELVESGTAVIFSDT